MELENITSSEVTQVQKVKSRMLSPMWNIDLIQYYEKQVMLSGCHIPEGKGKRRKLRM
jgi:hypothetical protein